MKRFPDKGMGEVRVYSVGLQTADAPGEAFTGAPTVTVENYELSTIKDPSPENLLSGSPSKNVAVVTIEGVEVPINRALAQKLGEGGVDGCTYAITYKCALTDGQTFTETRLLTVRKYVPH